MAPLTVLDSFVVCIHTSLERLLIRISMLFSLSGTNQWVPR